MEGSQVGKLAAKCKAVQAKIDKQRSKYKNLMKK